MFRSDVFYPCRARRWRLHALLTWAPSPPSPTALKWTTTCFKEFRDYLTKHNMQYTEPELAENLDWIKRKIKQEVFMSAYGTQEGFKVLLEADPQVQKAIEAVPQARALYENARKIVAQRSGRPPARSTLIYCFNPSSRTGALLAPVPIFPGLH